jgi:serine/threonine protein kinase
MILDNEISFNPDYWSEVSKETKDLILKLLEKGATKRLTVDQAINHPWFLLSGEELETKQIRLSADFS